jgi:hemerythrin
MKESDYPELGAHRREHEQFAQELSRLRGEHEATGPTTALVIEANERAVQWLRTHIAGTDRRFGAFWRERSRPGAPRRPSQPTERSA